jgi:hypothetical protein
MYGLAFTHALGFLVARVMETMDGDFERDAAGAERMRPAAGHRPRWNDEATTF